ncbi:MAG: hypothetical protein EXR50_06810 [Dehalococcoidia bacterium]|nr:hypothetical protein [Dehalococcoidia bacterium]
MDWSRKLSQGWRDSRDFEPEYDPSFPLDTPPECISCGALLSPDSRVCDFCGSAVSADQIVVGDEKRNLKPWFAAGILETPRTSLVRRAAATLLDLGVITLAISFIAGSIPLLGGLAFAMLCLVIVGAYYLFPYSSGGQTMGKKWLHIRVVAVDGSPLNWTRAVLRFIGYMGGAMPLMLGYLWALWDKDGQAWHDKFAGTIVIPEDYEFSPKIDGAEVSAQRIKWAAIITVAAAITVFVVLSLLSSE